MITVTIKPSFQSWRERARSLLVSGSKPETLLWEDGSTGADSLFQNAPEPSGETSETPIELKIPRAFLDLARAVACHRAPERWGILYRGAWRLTHGQERHLLEVATDDDVKRLRDWAAAVRRDCHKMKAFVRFRKVGERESDGITREQFVAWFEPEHHILELTAPFFAKRFAGIDWSILTPLQCAHWNGEILTYTDGARKKDAPSEDALEDHWRSYYAHIFNPARLKLKAMQAEMPKKYWRHLPEAPLIAELTGQAAQRERQMLDAPDSQRAHVSDRIPAGVPEAAPPAIELMPAEVLRQANNLDLEAIRKLSEQCVACPLHERATQTVFGQGPADAAIMIVGEQPGDAEDLSGRPFTGPAGRLLDRVLAEAGIDRESAYLTNTVKHFKWKRSGKRRLHQTPRSDEVTLCKPWLLAEILKVRPHTLVCLGATAARALIRADFSLLRERGRVSDCPLAERVIATLHPSYLLRLRDGKEREAEYKRWLADLRLAQASA